jgi:hypothetical protein
MELHARTAVGLDEAAALRGRLSRVRTLEDVLRILPTQPRAALDEVVTQDEYTHDVIIRWPAAPPAATSAPPRYLVFDTT